MISANYTITEAAQKVLEDNADLLSIEEIHEQILLNNLFEFKDGTNSQHVLTSQIHRKCINSKLSYKNKNLLFYHDKDLDKYGLLEWLSDEEITKLNEINDLQESRDSREVEYRKTIESLKGRISSIENNFENANAIIDQAAETEKNLKLLITSQKEKYEFHASRRYWSIKRKTHSQNATKFSRYFAFFIAITLSGAIYILIKMNPFPIHDINNHLIQQINFTNVGLLLFVTSIGLWISKILLKIVLSNLHLQEEAREKETMILTYLALIKEGAGLENKGLENDNRKIILDAIFRSSSNGIIKDDSNVTILDVINVLKAK